jgi:hypothetical protein
VQDVLKAAALTVNTENFKREMMRFGQVPFARRLPQTQPGAGEALPGVGQDQSGLENEAESTMLTSLLTILFLFQAPAVPAGVDLPSEIGGSSVISGRTFCLSGWKKSIDRNGGYTITALGRGSARGPGVKMIAHGRPVRSGSLPDGAGGLLR